MTTKIEIGINSEIAVLLPDTGSILVLDAGATLSTGGTAISAGGSAARQEIYVNGTLKSLSGYGVLLASSGGADSPSFLSVSRTGDITSFATAVRIETNGSSLSNDGTIDGRLGAVTLSGATAGLVNTGLIVTSAGTGVLASGADAVVINHGTIRAATDAVRLSGSSAEFTNNGDIRATLGSGVVSTGLAASLINHGSMTAKGPAIVSTGDKAGVTNDGSISATVASAIATSGDFAVVTNMGTIDAKSSGVTMAGDHGKITNNGLITAGGTAVTIAADDAIVTNNRTIKAAGGVAIDGLHETVTNLGTITATGSSQAAVDLSGATQSSLHNSGLIEAVKTAFLGSDAADAVFNTGTITGAIKLGGGNDYFDGASGKINGVVDGGSGNDVYVVSDPSIQLREAARGGSDIVQSTVSFVLGDNFETLILNGTAALSATGNAAANQLHGNSGANAIDGKAGKDMIWGHGGADLLTGGGGADQFVFATKDGRDTITDFLAKGTGHDVLDLTGVDSVTGFKDLQHHMRQVGQDVLIDMLHGDGILLKNVTLAHLDAGDFLF